MSNRNDEQPGAQRVRMAVSATGIVLSCVIAAIPSTASCGLVDLRPVDLVIEPAADGTVLPRVDSPLRITFPVDPIPEDVLECLSVSGPDGAVEGDVTREGTTMEWVPRAGWIPGRMYRLRLEGSIAMSDGRRCQSEVDRSFYAVSSATPVSLLSVEPANGGSVRGPTVGTSLARLTFSAPMDRASTETAFSLSPVVDLDFDWNDDGTIMTVLAAEMPEPFTVYRWTLSDDAMSMHGVPSDGSGSGMFRTDLDGGLPSVVSCRPVIESGHGWLAVADDTGAVESAWSLAVRFDRPMKASSLEKAVRLEPSIPGIVVRSGDDGAVFIPDRPWKPGTDCALVIDGDVEDVWGKKPGRDTRFRVHIATPWLRITEAAVSGGAFMSDPASAAPGDRVMTVVPDDAAIGCPEGLCTVMLRFSETFGAAGKAMAASMIRLGVLFPDTLATPGLRSVVWVGPETVRLVWEGVKKPQSGHDARYELTVRGGEAGLCPSGPGQDGIPSGTVLEDDLSVVLEVLP